MPYVCVFSDKLDRQMHLYAYNSSSVGYQKRNWQYTHGQNILFKSLSSEIQQANIGDIPDCAGRSVSPTLFGTRNINEFYVILSFGILALALRQRNIDQTLFKSGAFKQMISSVNTIALEKYGANSVQQFDDPSSNVETPKRSRWSITDIAESTEISPPEKKR